MRKCTRKYFRILYTFTAIANTKDCWLETDERSYDGLLCIGPITDKHITEPGFKLNSTNHPPKWVAYKGKKLKAYSYSRTLKRQSSFLKFTTLLQRKTAADRLFHASTILTKKKYLCIYIYLIEHVVFYRGVFRGGGEPARPLNSANIRPNAECLLVYARHG